MTRNLKIALGVASVGLAGLLAAGGIAYADRGGHGWGPGGWRGDRHMMMERFTERYDTNKDGKISQDEINGSRTANLQKYDTDKDGSLSLAEFEQLWLDAQRQHMVREFQFFDRDGDSKVTESEYLRPMDNIVSRMDSNGDGLLSQDDRQQRWHKRHGRDGMGRGPDGGGGMGPGPSSDSDEEPAQ